MCAVIAHLGPFVLTQLESFILSAVQCIFYFPLFDCAPVFPCHCHPSHHQCKVEKLYEFQLFGDLSFRPYLLPLIHDHVTAISPHIPICSFPVPPDYIIALKYYGGEHGNGGFRIVALQTSSLIYLWRCPTEAHSLNFSIKIDIELDALVGSYISSHGVHREFETTPHKPYHCFPTPCPCVPSVNSNNNNLFRCTKVIFIFYFREALWRFFAVNFLFIPFE